MITIQKTLVKVIYDNNYIHTDTSNSDGICNGYVDQFGNDNTNGKGNGNHHGRVNGKSNANVNGTVNVIGYGKDDGRGNRDGSCNGITKH